MGKDTDKKFNAFIIDDNAAHAEILYNDLKEQPEFNDLHIFHSCSEATLPLLEIQPDVIFLDVEMPGCTGFDFFESIRNKIAFPVRVVFYSAYANYVLDALRHAAFDFLLKPYKQSELRIIIDRLLKEEVPPQYSGMLQGGQPLQRKVAIQTVNQLLLVTMEEVLHFQYSRSLRSWMIILTDGSSYRLHQTTTADDILKINPKLAKVGQGDIVNLTYLIAIENSTQRCRFCPPFENIEIYASRRSFVKLKEKFDFI